MHVSLIQTFLVASIIVMFFSRSILLTVMHPMPMMTMVPLKMALHPLIYPSLPICFAMAMHVHLVHAMLRVT
jgi:hypothetical protein